MRVKRNIAFEVAVTGVVSPNGIGVVEGCIECRKAGAASEPCAGFGSGCLVRLKVPGDHPQGGGRSRSE